MVRSAKALVAMAPGFKATWPGSIGTGPDVGVAQLGEIIAPASVDDIGLGHGMAQRLLGDIHHAVVALQETTLQAEADRRRRLDPTLRLKDCNHSAYPTLR